MKHYKILLRKYLHPCTPDNRLDRLPASFYRRYRKRTLCHLSRKVKTFRSISFENNLIPVEKQMRVLGLWCRIMKDHLLLATVIHHRLFILVPLSKKLCMLYILFHAFSKGQILKKMIKSTETSKLLVRFILLNGISCPATKLGFIIRHPND